MEKCRATLRIMGPTLNHRNVTIFMGRQPSYAHLPGERYRGVGRPQRKGMWQLTSENQIASEDLEEHIAWLLDQLESVASTLPDYMRSIGAEGDIYCYWEKDGNGGAFFHSSLLKRIAALELSLGVTIHYINEASEEVEA